MAACSDPHPGQKTGISTRTAKHSIVPVLACVAVIIWGHHRLELLLLAVFLAPLTVIHVGSMALVGICCWGIAIERISIFYGGTLCRFNIGGIPIEIGYWPIGGSTTFHPHIYLRTCDSNIGTSSAFCSATSREMRECALPPAVSGA